MINNKIHKKQIGDVNPGQYVKTSNGYSLVYFTYAHNTGDKRKIVQLETLSDSVKVTENHLVYVKRSGNFTYLTAANIMIGDYIQTNLLDKIYWSRILKISHVYEPAKYVLTLDGDIIVNDLVGFPTRRVVSCYTDDYYIGYYVTYPLRWIYDVCPLCMRQDYNPVVDGLKAVYLMVVNFYLMTCHV